MGNGGMVNNNGKKKPPINAHIMNMLWYLKKNFKKDKPTQDI